MGCSCPHSGSSPLTRGKRLLMVHLLDLQRLIPAHAGKTRPPGGGRTGPAAHPRSRGENSVPRRTTTRTRGSSPLTRGKLARRSSGGDSPRLIPAHAGKTQTVKTSFVEVAAHPRSRGENSCQRRNNLIFSGSSPLTRGKPRTRRPDVAAQRLIPAHAGKTPAFSAGEPRGRAHPRSRGENGDSSR